MAHASQPPSDRFAAQARRLAAVWFALLLLLLASCGSAYLRLGTFNLVAGLLIALAKAALIAVAFMHLPRASAWARVAVVVAFVALALLWGLTWLEGRTRMPSPVEWQQPRQLPPLRERTTPATAPSVPRQGWRAASVVRPG